MAQLEARGAFAHTTFLYFLSTLQHHTLRLSSLMWSISLMSVPSLLGLCSLSVNLWGPAQVLAMTSLVVLRDPFQPCETF